MKLDVARYRAAFFEEAGDHLRALETGLLALEQTPGDAELLNGIFRAAHSIKGASAMLGFAEVTEFTHAMETLLDALRQAPGAVTPAQVGLLLRSTDVLGDLVDAARTGAVPTDARHQLLTDRKSVV